MFIFAHLVYLGLWQNTMEENKGRERSAATTSMCRGAV
uniref:Uncharacterized protein n=1 Tax=Oryza rufipogon TaxID=4529 RepID=A0A0E0R4C3_ORYRU